VSWLTRAFRVVSDRLHMTEGVVALRGVRVANSEAEAALPLRSMARTPRQRFVALAHSAAAA